MDADSTRFDIRSGGASQPAVSDVQVEEELKSAVALFLAGRDFLDGASASDSRLRGSNSGVPSGLPTPTRGGGYSACVKCGFAIVGTGIDQRANGPQLSMSC